MSFKEKLSKLKPTSWIHIVIIIIISLLIIFSVVKLVIWSIGIQWDPSNNVSHDDYSDNEDYILYYTPDELKEIDPAYADDGEQVILLLGDESLNDYEDGSGVAQLLEKELDATVYNCSFAGSDLAVKYEPYHLDYANDALSLYWLTVCITGGDFSFQDYVWNDIEIADDKAAETLETLKGIDFSKVDTLIIQYNVGDYLDGRTVTNVADEKDFTAYTGAIRASVDLFKESYPNLQIILSSPTYCLVNIDGTWVGGDMANTGYGMLSAYMIAAKNAAVDGNITFLDNYLGLPINENTYEDYLEDDYTLLNEAGRKLEADRYVSVINGSYSEN